MDTITILKRVMSGAVLLVVGMGVQAQIVTSQHDLTSSAGQGPITGTTQVCVFCHTPHGSDSSAVVPLWNKDLSTPPTYTRYSSLATATFDSLEAPVGSVSLACLSCHDGTQAMDAVLNMPGTGMNPGNIGGAGTLMTGGPVPVLGTDLTDDHPISMQYAGGGVNDSSHTLTTTPSTFSGTLGDPDFKNPVGMTINTQPMWWVDSPTGTASVREKTDMLLYTRGQVGGTGTVEPFVECGSCHDPHNASTKSTVAPLQVAFLRIPQTTSQICTSCHSK